MPDYELTGGGASQEQIADGADESDGRWQTLYAGGLFNNKPTRIVTRSSGAAPDFNSIGVEMASGSSGDRGLVGAVDIGDSFNNTLQTGTLLIKATYGTQLTIGNINDQHNIGVCNEVNMGGDDNIAVFRPNVGDSTTGNVRVDSGGTDEDGSITYPATDEKHSYTVLIDYSGQYIGAGNTGFYIDKDPRRGESPGVELSSSPNPDSRLTGVAYNSNGNSDTMRCDYLEVSIRR